MTTRLGDLPSLAVRRPTLIVVLNLLIIVAGLSALLGVEVRELPDVDRPWVSVRAFFEGASPETMDAEVTSVIEAAVARVAGVREISSASEEDNSRIWAQFAPNVNIDVAANDVREAVSGVERRLPKGVDDIVVVKADTNARPIIRLALRSSHLSQEALTYLAEEDVKPELTAIPGVAMVNLFGERRRVLRVIVDPMRLASYHLSIDDISRVLRSTDMDVPAGSFKSEDQLLLVRADASLWQPKDVERLAINDQVRLGDVAQASYGPKEALSHTLLNGSKVIGLTLVRKAKSNTIAISDAVNRSIEHLNRRLKGAEVIKISDDARFIRGSIREVLQSLGIATLIVIAVIYVFMRALRPTLILAATIPIALAGTLAAIWLLGFSINILTLLALVLATGMIVDDAIVVVENIQRQRHLGKPPLAASVLGTRQVFFAVLATTATLVSVFLPIAFLPSVAGRLFSEFGFVLAIAVGISSFVALTLCPMLASRLPASWGTPGLGSPNLLTRLGRSIVKVYERLLDFTLGAPVLILGLAIFSALGAVIIFPTVDRELLPKEDRGAIIIYMQGPDGVGLDYMDRQSAKAEALLQPLVERGEVSNIFAIVGRWDLNRVYLLAPLTHWSKRSRTQKEIAKSLRGPLKAIPGATARVSTPNSLNLRRSGGRLEFTLTGGNYSAIASAADAFLAAIHNRLPNLDDPEIEYQQTQPQLSIKVDRQRAEDLGIAVEGITATLRAMVDGLEVAELNVNDRTIPVRIESAAGAINDPSDLQNLFVRASTGKLVPLSAFITLDEIGVAAELDRAGQKRAIEIDAPLAPDYSLQQAMADVEALADEILPAGIGLHFIREAATLKETSHDVEITFAVAILIVFLVLAAQFESVFSAVVIVLTVPFGLAAAVFALKITDTSLNIYSQIGLVMLVGLMAKNGILVVEFADQLRDRGQSVKDAVREAAITRLRPVMMTMLSTVLGALPLILGSGPGVEARAAIGWVVFGGLGLATIFTLVLIPVLYFLLARFRAPRVQAGQRLTEQLRQSENMEDVEYLSPS